jgi:cobaltochelatase CobS
MDKQQLLDLINDPNTAPDIVSDAREQLAKLDALEITDDNQAVDNDIRFAVTEFSEAIDKLVTQGVNKSEVSKIVDERLSKAKLGKNNLDKSLIDLIGKTQTIQVVNPQGVPVKTSDGQKRRVFDLILSDMEAGNNVYLYGGAGTGKTYIAGQVAKALNYKLITLNCNQFTSPLDVIGGQTIDGYQEGRLTDAFGNLFMPEISPKTGKPFSGAVLLLDELPKLDPNTAGVLNDGLSKIKDPDEVADDGSIVRPTIQNGRGKVVSKGNIFVIATGNSLLNEADADYEANFKQDLSLQDRFAGSCYELIIDPQYELDEIMSNFMVQGSIVNLTFIFNFLFRLRQAIEKNNFTSRAFVSQRLMVSFKDTYIAYRVNEEMGDSKIPRPKTLEDAVNSFLTLFTKQQRETLMLEIDTKEFFDLIQNKNQKPLSDLRSDEDTQLAKALIDNFNASNEGKIK